MLWFEDKVYLTLSFDDQHSNAEYGLYVGYSRQAYSQIIFIRKMYANNYLQMI